MVGVCCTDLSRRFPQSGGHYPTSASSCPQSGVLTRGLFFGLASFDYFSRIQTIKPRAARTLRGAGLYSLHSPVSLRGQTTFFAVDPETKGPYLTGSTFETLIVEALRNYVNFILSLGRGYPIVIFISLCGVRGCYVRTTTEIGAGYYNRGPLTEDVIPLPEISIESDTQDVASAFQPVFNQIWNAFGLMASTKFDKDGKWIGRSL
jgi:hypothetical protein